MYHFKFVYFFYRSCPCLAKGARCGHIWGGGLLRELNKLPTLALSKTVKCVSGLLAHYTKDYASERIPCIS